MGGATKLKSAAPVADMISNTQKSLCPSTMTVVDQDGNPFVSDVFKIDETSGYFEVDQVLYQGGDQVLQIKVITPYGTPVYKEV